MEPTPTCAITGLGLPTVQAIVERLGGAVDIESVEGSGTRVNVTLPCGDEGYPGVEVARR